LVKKEIMGKNQMPAAEISYQKRVLSLHFDDANQE
jgi:hypothetical protein